MSALMDRVSADLISAMKERREKELSVLRMLKSEEQKFQADKGRAYEVTDEDVVMLVKRLIKQRHESADMYVAAGAKDRAQSELDETKYLEVYLPAQCSAEEIETVVKALIVELGVNSPRQMGKLMGVAMKKLRGKADGDAVRDIVQRLLKS